MLGTQLEGGAIDNLGVGEEDDDDDDGGAAASSAGSNKEASATPPGSDEDAMRVPPLRIRVSELQVGFFSVFASHCSSSLLRTQRVEIRSLGSRPITHRHR